MGDVTGAHFKPLFPAYVINEDSSSQYYFAGTAQDGHINNGWSHVTTQSLNTRNK